MSLDPTLRIGDADRDRVVAVLGQHLGLGHLTIHELENRLDTTYAARTRGELDVVLADLPAMGPPRPRPSPAGEASALSIGPDAHASLDSGSSRGAGVAITAGA